VTVSTRCLSERPNLSNRQTIKVSPALRWGCTLVLLRHPYAGTTGVNRRSNLTHKKIRVKRDTGKGGRRRARRFKCAAVPPEQAGVLSPMSLPLHLSVYPLSSPVPKTSCISVPMICANGILDLQGAIHGILLSYLLNILKTSSKPLMKVSTFSKMSKKRSSTDISHS
jgi:hypothetical protein